MAERDRINNSFTAILESVKYKRDGTWNLDTQPKAVPERLGRLFFDYMIASIHDTNWEGFSEEDLEGIDALMYDLSLAAKATEVV